MVPSLMVLIIWLENHLTSKSNVSKVLESTERLFEAVERNLHNEVEEYIKSGGSVNAKNADSKTLLHIAASGGYIEIVNVLLHYRANANAVCNKGFTPVHHATKFAHLNVVKTLLTHGAIYNSVSICRKTPIELSNNNDITNLLKLINKSYKKIKTNNCGIINDLEKITDIDSLKAIMRTHCRDNKTLITTAILNNFSKIEELKAVGQGNILDEIDKGKSLFKRAHYQKALNIFDTALKKRISLLGPENPATLDIQKSIGKVLCKQGDYHEALNKFEEILEKQKQLLGLNHDQTVQTWYQLSGVLMCMGKLEEAISNYKALLEHEKKSLDACDEFTLEIEENISTILMRQGKLEESLIMKKEVLEKKKKILGTHHVDTLRTHSNIGEVFFKQNNYDEALDTFKEVFNIQKKVPTQTRPESLLTTRYQIGKVLCQQHKFIAALKLFNEGLEEKKLFFGQDHPVILKIATLLQLINQKFKCQQNATASEILLHVQEEMKTACCNGDARAIDHLLREGADVNDKYENGTTLLHYAVSNKQIDVVKTLLKFEVEVTQVTDKGNTALHTACFKGCKEIVNILLKNIDRKKLNEFVNAKTNTSGTTSLHLAAKNGYLDIIKSVLKFGANYEIQNKEKQTPIGLSGNQETTKFLKLIEELFNDAKEGNFEIISKLKKLQLDELLAVTNACNNQQKTLVQVALLNKQMNIAKELIRILEDANKEIP